MKKVFVYSVQHTGTFFTSAMLAAGFHKEEALRIGSLWTKHKKLGHKQYIKTKPTELSDFTKPSEKIRARWFDEGVLSVCKESQLAGKKIVIAHEHHHKPGSWFIKSLARKKPEVKIVIPMRDPLLSLHSKLWREDEEHKNPNEMSDTSRYKRLDKWIQAYTEMLSLPREHAFLLPIDTEQSKTEQGRIKLIKRMHDFCDLNFNEKAKKKALEWKPQNRTYNLIEKIGDSPPKPQWENFKERYLDGDIKHTRSFMSLEFDVLAEQEKLKKLMKQAGYKNLPWW